MKTLILIYLISIAVNTYAQTVKQVRVNLCDSTHKVYDGTLTEYDDSNNDAIDGRDAVKMNNFQWNFGLLRNGTNLIVERRKTVDTIFFNMWGNVYYMKYALEINSIGLPPGRLEDKYLNTAITFGDGYTYYPFKVDTDKGSFMNDRFRIIFTQPAISKSTATKVTVFPNPSSKWINYRIDGKSGSYRVYFYNDLGVLVYTRKASVTDNGFSQRIYLTGGSKFYTLKVVSPDSIATTTKVVIQ